MFHADCFAGMFADCFAGTEGCTILESIVHKVRESLQTEREIVAEFWRLKVQIVERETAA